MVIYCISFICTVADDVKRFLTITALYKYAYILSENLTFNGVKAVGCRGIVVKAVDYNQDWPGLENYSRMVACLERPNLLLFNIYVQRSNNLPHVGPGHPSSPCPFTSSSFPPLLFSFFHWLYLFSSFVHPFPFYQNSPTPFSRPEVVGGDRTWV